MRPPQFVQVGASGGDYRLKTALSWIRRQCRLDSGRCIYCNNLDPRGHEDSAGTKNKFLYLDSSYSSLAKGEVRGCSFCSLVRTVVDHFVPGRLPSEHLSVRLCETQPVIVRVPTPASDESFCYTELLIYVTPGMSISPSQRREPPFL